MSRVLQRRRQHWLALSGLFMLLVMLAGTAMADVFKPAYLELHERANHQYDVMWKVPAVDESMRLTLLPVFPEGTTEVTPQRVVFTGDAVVAHWRIQRAAGLVGPTIRFEGHALGVSDIIVRYERLDGTSETEHLGMDTPQFVLKPATSTAQVAWSYLTLGVEHILSGIDHLLFILALLLIVRGGKRIFATITAFTLAHSITLVSATMGWVHVPGAPVEAMIALSIVFVAAEVVHGMHGKPGLTARAPWVVAFSFGLLHGFGFASALAEVGLPQKAIPVALLMFNVGVECGQLIFVAFVLSVLALIKRVRLPLPRWSNIAAPYVIGTLAMYWVIDRVGAFWS